MLLLVACLQHSISLQASSEGDVISVVDAVGGAIAGLLAAPLYGVGAAWLKDILPWHKATESPTGPHGKLEDHAIRRHKSQEHSPSDSASSPNTRIPSSEAEHAHLQTMV